jgi:hypothetical protein
LVVGLPVAQFGAKKAPLVRALMIPEVDFREFGQVR